MTTIKYPGGKINREGHSLQNLNRKVKINDLLGCPQRTDGRHEAQKPFFPSHPMFKFFSILHLLKHIYLRRFSIPEKKCVQKDCESRSKPVWEKQGILYNLSGCQTWRTLRPKWFWSVKTKTNQTHDKCLQPGSRVFTRQQLAFKTQELWPKMNWMQPKPLFNAPGKSGELTATADKTHRFTGLVRSSQAGGHLLAGQDLFLKASAYRHTLWYGFP